MPIYDNDGSTNYQIGKLYDSDGTTSYQIGKVYDNDGTSNSLIYSAEAQFYPGASVGYRATNSGTVSGFSTTAPNGDNINSTIAYIAVDLTGINTLTVTGYFDSAQTNTQSGAWLATYNQLFGNSDSGGRYPYYTVGPGVNTTYYTQMRRVLDGATASTFTFDVSGLTGTYYLAIGVYNNGWNGRTGSARVDTVIGT